MDRGAAVAWVNRHDVIADLLGPEQTVVMDAGVEVMDLQGELALENIQSGQDERPVVALTILADIFACHEAQVNLKDIASGSSGGFVGAGAHPLYIGQTDMPVKVSDQGEVVFGRVRAAKRWITRQEDMVDGCSRAERLDSSGDWLGAGAVSRSAAREIERYAQCQGVESRQLEELSPGERDAFIPCHGEHG
ncbi:MAG TPA: hypothetical protein VE136_10905 [Anaerolineales bacterium]|nr:hypothetical protein [Anaerolineales bacterium]